MPRRQGNGIMRPSDPADIRPSQRKPGRLKTNRTLIRRLMTKALDVTPEELDSFVHDCLDLQMAEAVMEGMRTYEDLANALNISRDGIKYRLRNPVRCAWISAQMLRIMPQRVGRVWASMYARAVAGDVRAATLFLERFDPLFRPASSKATVSAENVQINFNSLSDEELSARIQDKLRTAPLPSAPPETPEDAPESTQDPSPDSDYPGGIEIP